MKRLVIVCVVVFALSFFYFFTKDRATGPELRAPIQARALSETYFKELPHEQFLAEARRIDDRYTTLCQALEPTDKEAFERARERVKAGVFTADFREKAKE